MPRYLDIKEAASTINVKEKTLRAWIHLRKIKYTKFGSLIRIREDDLINFGVVKKTIENIADELLEID